jgi:hypothetical protein
VEIDRWRVGFCSSRDRGHGHGWCREDYGERAGVLLCPDLDGGLGQGDHGGHGDHGGR